MPGKKKLGSCRIFVKSLHRPGRYSPDCAPRSVLGKLNSRVSRGKKPGCRRLLNVERAVELREGPRHRASRRIRWGTVLEQLPKEFKASNLRQVRGLKDKRSSELFAAITRWIKGGSVKKKARAHMCE